MKNIILLLPTIMAACSITTLTDGKFTAEHRTFAGYEQAGKVILKTPSGSTLEVDAVKNDTAQGAEAIAEGVTRGLASGAKP